MDKAQIRAILGDAVKDDGSLSKLGDGIYLSWPDLGCKDIAHCDGYFTAGQLEAIAAHMRAHMGNGAV